MADRAPGNSIITALILLRLTPTTLTKVDTVALIIMDMLITQALFLVQHSNQS